MLLILWIVIFIVSAIVLGVAADYFVDSASVIGLYLGLSPIMIGIVFLSLGTSLPELAVSVLAVSEGSSEVVIANVVGSNITNIVLVLGLATVISAKLKIIYKNIHIDFFVGATFLLFIVIQDGLFTLAEGVLFIVIAIIYIWGSLCAERPYSKQAKEVTKEQTEEIKHHQAPKRRHILIFIATPIFIFLGAQYTLVALRELATMLEIGQEVIAAVGVAFGTSLPELVTTIALARRGHTEAIIGNIMGSNIFNILIVMGIPALIGSLMIPGHILTTEIPILLMVTLLYFFITLDKELSRTKGLLLLAFYVIFVVKVLGIF